MPSIISVEFFCLRSPVSEEIAASNQWKCCTISPTHEGLWLSRSACVLWQILAAPARCACSCAWTWLPDSLGLCLTLCYIVTWKAFPQRSLFSPVPWQPSTNILSWTDSTTRKYFLICRKCPPFFSDYRQQCRLRLAVTHLCYCCLFFLFAEPLFCTYFTHIFLEL